MTTVYDECEAVRALRAIIARYEGRWDQLDLVEFGPLSTAGEDMYAIAKRGLRREYFCSAECAFARYTARVLEMIRQPEEADHAQS